MPRRTRPPILGRFARALRAIAGMIARGLLALALTIAPGACTADSTNTDFPVSGEFVDARWDFLPAHPVPMQRPIVILGGYREPSLFVAMTAGDIRRLTGAPEEEVLFIGYPLASNFPDAAAAVVDAVDRRWPSDDPHRTVEVDVIAISMGGLVARAAAMHWADAEAGWPLRRLRIARLFTLATPHRGALLAETIALDSAARDMQAGSAFLAALDEGLPTADYDLYCYARTRDDIVGATRAAPPGHEPMWLEGPLLFSHMTIQSDRRILLDIAQRLRGEEPLALRGSAPPRD